MLLPIVPIPTEKKRLTATFTEASVERIEVVIISHPDTEATLQLFAATSSDKVKHIATTIDDAQKLSAVHENFLTPDFMSIFAEAGASAQELLEATDSNVKHDGKAVVAINKFLKSIPVKVEPVFPDHSPYYS